MDAWKGGWDVGDDLEETIFWEFQIVELIGFGYICCTNFERSPSSTNFYALVNLDIWLEHILTDRTLDHRKRVFSGIFDTSLASLARNCTYTKKWTVAPLLGVLWRHSSLVSLLITETSSSSFPEGAQASLGCRRWWNYGLLVETWILISGVKWEVEIFPIHPNISYTEQFQICTLIYTGSVKWEGERVLLILVSLISEYFEYSNRPIKVLRGKYSSISIPHIRVGSAKWVGEEKGLFEKKHIFQFKNHNWYEDEANS